jgi:hypothetical protein
MVGGARDSNNFTEIYAKSDQNKFVGVASEIDDDGKPFLPTFYKSRIYIDMSQSEIYAANFEQLLRWIYDKPAHPKTPLGRLPEFLNDNAIQLPTRSRANRAVELVMYVVRTFRTFGLGI